MKATRLPTSRTRLSWFLAGRLLASRKQGKVPLLHYLDRAGRGHGRGHRADRGDRGHDRNAK